MQKQTLKQHWQNNLKEGKKMSFENHQLNAKNEYDECTLHGICSISPTASAVKATTLGLLQELAFYIVKARDLGARNNRIKSGFIEIFSTLIPTSEYSQKNIDYIISNMQEHISEVKNLYKQLCYEKNVQANFFKNSIKISENFTIADIVKQGQKYSEKIKRILSEEQNKSLEILLIILKSMCLYIIELQDLNADIDKYYEELLKIINIKNFNELDSEALKDILKKYAQLDTELMNTLFEARKKEFSDFIEAEVLLSPKEGKAILVAGTNLKDLELVLEATKDKGINVYTHGQMIIGHTLPKLKAYKHLVGHYGKGVDSYLSDFSTFPGAIFLTKHSLCRVEKLCFCSLYSTDKIATQNTTTINDNNFEPLIHSALRAEGFTESESEKFGNFGIIEQNYLDEITKLAQRINKKEIKYVLGIGVPNKTDSQIEYFKKFWKLLKPDCFVITFNYHDNFKNIIFNNMNYCFPFLYKGLNILLKEKQTNALKIGVFNSRCELHTIPNLISLKTAGVDKIYFSQCSSTLINPMLTELLLEWFDINKYTTPENDLKIMFKE